MVQAAEQVPLFQSGPLFQPMWFICSRLITPSTSLLTAFCCCCAPCSESLSKFKLAKDSRAIYVDEPVTEKQMLTMAVQGLADVQQQFQQGMLDMRQHVKQELAQLQYSSGAAAAGASAAAAGGGGGASSSQGNDLMQQQGRKPVTEDEEMADLLWQLRSGPDAVDAAQLEALKQQREELAAAQDDCLGDADVTEPAALGQVRTHNALVAVVLASIQSLHCWSFWGRGDLPDILISSKSAWRPHAAAQWQHSLQQVCVSPSSLHDLPGVYACCLSSCYGT
jgi:hypothetical protein